MFAGTIAVCDTPSTAKQIFFGVAYLAMLGDHGREVDGWIYFALWLGVSGDLVGQMKRERIEGK